MMQRNGGMQKYHPLWTPEQLTEKRVELLTDEKVCMSCGEIWGYVQTHKQLRALQQRELPDGLQPPSL